MATINDDSTATISKEVGIITIAQDNYFNSAPNQEHKAGDEERRAGWEHVDHEDAPLKNENGKPESQGRLVRIWFVVAVAKNLGRMAVEAAGTMFVTANNGIIQENDGE